MQKQIVATISKRHNTCQKMKHCLSSQLFMLTAFVLLFACGKQPEPQPVVPGVPQNVVLHNAEETSLTFQWDPVEGATGYAWRLTSGGVQVKEGGASKRNVTVTGLEKATTYRFSVCALAGEKSSAYSAEIEATTAGEPYVPPGPDTGTMCVDAPIVLEFDTPPVLPAAGLIRVLDESGKEADRIDLADMATVAVRESDGAMIPKAQITAESTFNTFMDALHCGRWRIVHYTPLRIEGNKLIITLHSEALDFGKKYKLEMEGAVKEEFSTAPAPSKTEIRVAADGSGDFCTIQRALSHATDGATISVAAGTYRELLYLRDKKDITIKGDSRDGVRIVYPNNESYEGGSGSASTSKPAIGSKVGASGGRGLFLVENCDNLRLENLTIENSFGEQKGQAETIYFNSGNNTHRLTIEGCSLISWQDTFLAKGRVWVHNSLIVGHVDYIWGYPEVCLFEECEIRSRAAGYIIQARVPKVTDKGFVFLNCSLTAEDGVSSGSVYLARSAGQSEVFDNVVYVNCTMSPAISASGWYSNPAPNPSAPTATGGWREFGSKDAAGKPVTGHNAYGKELSATETQGYLSKESVLGW